MEIVWYIVWSELANTHIISPEPPPVGVLVKEVRFDTGWPAGPAIFSFVGEAEQLRNAGSAAAGMAVKVVMNAPPRA